jgi:hypothetical protein
MLLTACTLGEVTPDVTSDITKLTVGMEPLSPTIRVGVTPPEATVIVEKTTGDELAPIYVGYEEVYGITRPNGEVIVTIWREPAPFAGTVNVCIRQICYQISHTLGKYYEDQPAEQGHFLIVFEQRAKVVLYWHQSYKD